MKRKKFDTANLIWMVPLAVFLVVSWYVHPAPAMAAAALSGLIVLVILSIKERI